MRHHVLLCALCLLCALIGCPPGALRADVIHLLPSPQRLTPAAQPGAAPFRLGRAVRISDPTECQQLRDFFQAQGCTVSTDDATAPLVSVQLVEKSELAGGAHDYEVPGFECEAYELSVRAESVAIRCAAPIGALRAAQTLAQLALPLEEGAQPQLPAVDIQDWPAFKVRGWMHDVGRSFLSVERLKRHIELLAQMKMNVFHFHLTENQAWRMEVKKYPALTSASSMTRWAGSYYTQQQLRELDDYAWQHGVMVLPEVDMPGHSAAFERAMGHSMQTRQGVEELQNVLEEVAQVFQHSPYIHIGADEVNITYTGFLDIMRSKIHSLGRKAICWNPAGAALTKESGFDMTQMWAPQGDKSKGHPVEGMLNVNSRYLYTNHHDVFADLVGTYLSNVYHQTEGSPEVCGAITATWNDRKLPTEDDIVCQNNFFAINAAVAERTWRGGGEHYVDETGTRLPNAGTAYDDFAQWEERFLYHRAHAFKDEPIRYVRQANVRWCITDAFPNGGNADMQFPPETEGLQKSYTYQGKTYGTRTATGAGIYLRHTWTPNLPSLLSAPQQGTTAYAYTYVYSPREQTVGADIEFQTYARSETDAAPAAGRWDRKGSRLWLNDEELLPPTWGNTGRNINQEVPLQNENFTARPPLPVQLHEGWNKVLIKLPYNPQGLRLAKWQFTFVLTDLEGRAAVEGLVYSPTQTLSVTEERLSLLLEDQEQWIQANFRAAPGYYAPSLAAPLSELIAQVRQQLAQGSLSQEQSAQIEQAVAEARAALEAALAGAQVQQPLTSPDEQGADHYYTLSTPLRDSRYATSQGAGVAMTGEPSPSRASMWRFERRDDGALNLRCAQGNLYLSPASAKNSALKAVAAEPQKGWTLLPADELGYFAVASGAAQMNQTQSGLGYKVYNWGDGTNLSDAGCKYRIEETELPPAPSRPLMSTATDTYWYHLCTPLRGNRYPTSKGAGSPLVGETVPSAASTWKLIERAGEPDAFDLVCQADGTYIDPACQYNGPVSTSALQPQTGWTLLPAQTEGLFGVCSGTVQLNQTNNGDRQFWQVYNWGSGTNTSDTGCQYAFLLSDHQTHAEPQPDGLPGVQAALQSPSARYDLSGRRLRSSRRGAVCIDVRDGQATKTLTR